MSHNLSGLKSQPTDFHAVEKSVGSKGWNSDKNASKILKHSSRLQLAKRLPKMLGI